MLSIAVRTWKATKKTIASTTESLVPSITKFNNSAKIPPKNYMSAIRKGINELLNSSG
jgi:hypothetical protein